MSSQVLFNQFAYADRLKNGGFSDDQARALAEALATALSETVATKTDLFALEAKIEAKIGDTVLKVIGAQIAIAGILFAAIKLVR